MQMKCFYVTHQDWCTAILGKLLRAQQAIILIIKIASKGTNTHNKPKKLDRESSSQTG